MPDLPTYQALDLQSAGPWLTVWFNEPEKRNPLTASRMSDLDALCALLETRRDIRGVTFRGRGGIFCAGGDLKYFETISKEEAPRADIFAMSAGAGALFDRIDQLPQVVVMVVEGGAVAGGIGLACAGDITIVESSARFSLTETKLGLSAAQIAPFIVRRTGLPVARRLMLTARTFDGDEAGRIGLADHVCGSDKALTGTEAAIRHDVLQCAPGAIAETKKLLREIDGRTRAEQIDIAAECFAGRILSAEGKEGVAAFLQRRKPSWNAGGQGT